MAEESETGGDRARLILPQLQLTELQARLEAARATRDRVHALLEAVVSVGSELDLETVLLRITEAATTLVDARYRLDGLLDTAVDDETGEHLLAVVREALSNVARHARATETAVVVDVGDEVLVRVEDNGVGIGEGGRRSGLRNMDERARGLGGSCVTEPRPGGSSRRTGWARSPAWWARPEGWAGPSRRW